MKRTVMITAVFCLCCACRVTDLDIIREQKVIPVEISVPLPDTGTKAVDTGGETRLNRLQVFVFRDEDGQLDASASSDENVIKLNCSAGDRTVVALANAPEIKSCTSLSQIESMTSYLSDNSVSNFVMYGKVGRNITASGKITVPVSRLAARICISKITNALDPEQSGVLTFKIKRIYLVNVPADMNYGGTSSPLMWYNKGGRGTDVPDLVSSEEMDETLPAGKSYSTVNSFYIYPNPVVSDSSLSEWTPRKTRLVVEAAVGGRTYYYPVTISSEGGLESNHSYNINELKITRLGSLDPDIPVSVESVDFEITVAGWTTVSVGDEII